MASSTDYSILQLLAETGPTLAAWPTVKHFTAWMGLAPSSRQSGKRRRRERRFRNRAGRLFCVMARSLARSNQLGLGGFHRRLSSMRGPAIANVASARKLAVLYYNTLRHGLAYVEQGLLKRNPFETIDPDGVGQLVRIGAQRGRAAKKGLKLGVCGEHGGDPESIALFYDAGLAYVSCSPFRVPIARLAAAQAVINTGGKSAKSETK